MFLITGKERHTLNPIAHGPFIPWLPRGGAESTPPAKITLRSVRFQFFYTCIESYIQLAKIKKKIQKNFENGREIGFLKKFQKFCPLSGHHENVRYSAKIQYFEL